MSKIPNINSSIFTIMAQISNKYNAINLSQGFPNFPVDQNLKDSVIKWTNEEIHQYLPMAGYPPLLAKIAKLTLKSYHRNIQANTSILITAGATQGIFASIHAIVHKNDEVIILDPSYDSYEPTVLLCHAKPIRVPLNNDFTPNWEAIGNTINPKTRMLIINNPHNPTGKIWTEEDYNQLELLMDANPNLILLSDEVYEYITFEKKHISVHNRPKLWERSICISSFGKSFHITGWKIGYVIAPEHLMIEIKKVHQFMVFTVNSIAQYAVNDYLDLVEVSELGHFYQQKRDLFRNLLKDTKLELLPCEGTYFQVASYDEISNKNDLEFARDLVTNFGVATIPLSPFYASKNNLKRVRFCFAKEDDTLIKAAEKLIKL